MTGRSRTHSPRGKARAAVPVRTIELEIHNVGARGDGAARLGDDAVFVPFTVAGDRVLARIEGKRGDGLVAALVEVLSPGPGRAEPPCPHFSRCGGCALQHMDDATYETWKRDLLVTQLSRHHLGDAEVAPLVRVAPGSRRRATFAFLRRQSEALIGFNGRASHAVIDMERCLLLEEPFVDLLKALRPILAATVPGGGSGDVIVTHTETGMDVLVEAEARLDLFDRERLAAFADEHDLARLSWRRPGAGFIEPISRRRAPVVRFGGIAVEPPPGAFLQPTKIGEDAIVGIVLAAIGSAKTVADLYSGSGTFTLPLAATGRPVHAVEGEEGPVLALDAAMRRNGLNITTQVRDIARRPLLIDELKRFQAIVLDPPRAGAAPQVEMIVAAGPATVIMVSCNPATLARDLRTLVEGGYKLESVTPIDQFPWSPHLEAVAVLRR